MHHRGVLIKQRFQRMLKLQRRSVFIIGDLDGVHELRGGLLLGSVGGNFVLELRGRILSRDHGCDDIIELHSVWSRNVSSFKWR